MSYPPQQPPYGPPPPPPKQGMSTGAKFAIFGCGGCLVLVIIAVIALFALGLFAASEVNTTPPSSVEASSSEQAAEEPADGTAEEPATESAVTITATDAGTVGDTIDDTVYTAIDIEVVNGSDEPIDVNPINFSVVLADGTAASDWADAIFADIDPLEAVTLQPGERTSGQIAVVGEVDPASVEMGDILGLNDPIVADVQ